MVSGSGQDDDEEEEEEKFVIWHDETAVLKRLKQPLKSQRYIVAQKGSKMFQILTKLDFLHANVQIRKRAQSLKGRGQCFLVF